MFNNKVKKLTTNDAYVRPTVTYTDKLTKEEIDLKLKDYKEVKNLEELSEIPLGVHLRYFVKQKDGTLKFRLGGQLYKKDHIDKYIILSNGDKSWSVNTKKATFYRKMTIEEIRENYEHIIKKKDKLIKELMHQLKKLKDN